MHYTVTSGEHRRKLRAFVEVDRTTMSSERLAAKLIEYARLWSYEPPPMGRRRAAGPGWLRWYPVFPRVLFVLTGATPYVLNNRISDLQAMVAQHLSWARWPSRCRSAQQSWTASNTRAPAAMSGCLWSAASRSHGPSCESAACRDGVSQPCNCPTNHLIFAFAN